MSEILLTSLPRAEILNLVQQLTRTNVAPGGWPTIWDGEPSPFIGAMNGAPGAYLELGIHSYRTIGVDDYRQTYDAATQTNTSAMAGLRQFTLTIDCRSYNFDLPAFDILEVLRLRLNNPRNVTAIQAMRQACISVARLQPYVELPCVIDNREAFRGAIDVVFNWASNAVTGDDAGGVILTVGPVAQPSPPGTNKVTGTLLPP